MRYFERRRRLAGGRITIVEHAQLAKGDTVVRLADGEVELDGERLRWRTAGVYRLAGPNIAEAWLVPLDLAAFEEVWHRLARRSQRELGEHARVVGWPDPVDRLRADPLGLRHRTPPPVPSRGGAPTST